MATSRRCRASAAWRPANRGLSEQNWLDFERAVPFAIRVGASGVRVSPRDGGVCFFFDRNRPAAGARQWRGAPAVSCPAAAGSAPSEEHVEVEEQAAAQVEANGRQRRSARRMLEFQQAKRAAARARLVRCVHQRLRLKLMYERRQAVWVQWMRRNLARAKLRGIFWRAWTYPMVEWRQRSEGPLCLLSRRDSFILLRARRIARAAELPAADLRAAGGTWSPADLVMARCTTALYAASAPPGSLHAGEASSCAAVAARASGTASSTTRGIGAKRVASRSPDVEPRTVASGAVQHGKGGAKRTG